MNTNHTKQTLVINPITETLSIINGFDPLTWNAYTSLVRTKEGIVIKTLWEEMHAFTFTSENEAHKQFLMDLQKDLDTNDLKQAM